MIKTLSNDAANRLYAVIPLLLANVASSQMTAWCRSRDGFSRPLEANICNTELCVGGWLVYQDKGNDLLELAAMTDAEIEARASELLGFDNGACGLFYVTHWPRSLKELYNFSTQSPEARTFIMAGAIRRFAANPLAFRQDGYWYDDEGDQISCERVW